MKLSKWLLPLKHVKDRVQGKAPKGKKRSIHWPDVRALHLKENPTCESCGGDSKIEVHHVVPFHLDPDLELDPKNLITLCERKKYGINCHLAIGHHGNYKRVNEQVREHARYCLELLQSLASQKEKIPSDS
jgi:5-methylcytosine-specific restriction protein A